MDWNTKLFLRINGLIGRNRWLDAFGRAGAEWVIFAILAWFTISFFEANGLDFRFIIKGMVVVFSFWFLGMVISHLTAFFVGAVRPHLKHPESKYLFLPFFNWKTFPSDHTYTAFFFFFIAVLVCLTPAWIFLPLALWVGWGRLYAGVHYPLDILGGVVLAGLVATFYYFFATYFINFLGI